MLFQSEMFKVWILFIDDATEINSANKMEKLVWLVKSAIRISMREWIICYLLAYQDIISWIYIEIC